MQFAHDITLVYNQGDGENNVNNSVWRENFVQCLLFTLEEVTGAPVTIPLIELSAENVQQELNIAKLVIILIDDPFLESNISDQILRVYAENQVNFKNILPLPDRSLLISSRISIKSGVVSAK